MERVRLMSRGSHSFACALLLLAHTPLVGTYAAKDSESNQAQHRYWQETESETLWWSRYSNCDYGFHVLLGDRVVAHGTLPPAPNHGFYVSLPDVGGTRTNYPTSDRDGRYIWWTLATTLLIYPWRAL